MRALFIAIAFDAIATDDVVNKDAGGSVPTEYREIRRNASPDAEPTLELVLRHRRVLERARVSPKNRRPEGWEAPPANVPGRRRKLKPGYKRCVTAETEARDYASIGREFPGLPDDMTFVSAHARGTPASEVPLRRARFCPKSETALLLGSLGLGPNSGKRKGGAKKSKRSKKR